MRSGEFQVLGRPQVCPVLSEVQGLLGAGDVWRISLIDCDDLRIPRIRPRRPEAFLLRNLPLFRRHQQLERLEQAADWLQLSTCLRFVQ